MSKGPTPGTQEKALRVKGASGKRPYGSGSSGMTVFFFSGSVSGKEDGVNLPESFRAGEAPYIPLSG